MLLLGKLTALAHLVQAVLVFWLRQTNSNLVAGSGRLPVYTPVKRYSVIGNSTVTFFELRTAFTADIPLSIALFFVLSATFQAFGVFGFGDDALSRLRLRYAEYSVSAGLMLMDIALEVGIQDTYTLFLMFFFMFSCNMMGMLADFLYAYSEDAPWFALVHAVGWVDLVVPYTMVLVQFFHTVSENGSAPPGFVYAIVICMALLFAVFGLVQIYDLATRPVYEADKDFEPHVEYVGQLYDVLSLTAKSLLAWLVMGPLLSQVPMVSH